MPARPASRPYCDGSRIVDVLFLPLSWRIGWSKYTLASIGLDVISSRKEREREIFVVFFPRYAEVLSWHGKEKISF